MPRVLRPKHYLRVHPANSSATRSGATRRPFKYKVHQRQTNFQRLLVALHAIRPTGPTAVQDILEKISTQAADNEEILGSRWNQFVHVALSVLRKNDYLEVQVQDDEEYCRLTEDGIQIMTETDAWFGSLWNQLSSFEKCRRAGQYIQWQISPNPIRPLTRRELDVENQEFERRQKEHKKICPMLLGLKLCQTCATSQNKITHDLMDVDGVPVAVPSITNTPIQKFASLHNPAAYPTPQSPPRSRSRPQPASIPPPQTPLARNHSSGILEEDQSSNDNQADNGVTITVSNEGEVAVDRVVVVTCHNMDWQNIAHVAAISKALQERNDFLQQEKDILEKKKEECTRQLDQANSKVELLEAEKRNLQSRSWLSKWRSVIGMTVLKKALDSAIHDRERHKDQNAHLQARLDDIERRRAAIRRIEDAENAPDDQLLTVIDKSLKLLQA